MKHNLVSVHSRTIFQFNNSKFAQIRKFRANFQKIQKLKYLKASIDFGRIQYQKSSLDMLYLRAVLGP